MAQPASCLLIGIDFGTTYSSAAWAWSRRPDDIHVVSRWGPGYSHDSVKVPSQILYEKDGTSRWGFNIRIGEKPLKWFKIFLLQEEDMRQPLMDEKFRQWPSFREAKEELRRLNMTGEDVVADYLKHLWVHVVRDMEKFLGESLVGTSQSRVVLTIPAFWPLYAQSRFRHAAMKAGILESRAGGKTQLHFLPGLEATALSMIDDFGPAFLEKDDIFIICDAGGGAVDLITYEVDNAEKWQLKECVSGAGKLCGGTFVDEAFEQKMSQWLTPVKWKRISDDNKQLWEQSFWESSLKKNFSGSENGIQLTLPLELSGSDIFRFKGIFQRNEEGSSPKVKNGQLLLRTKDIAGIFDVSVDQIIDLIQQQILETRRNVHRTPKAVFLVGGFGQSPYLFIRLYNAFRNKGIMLLKPPASRSWTTVCCGAVHQAIMALSQEFQEHVNGPTISSRIMRSSYGIEITEPFDPSKHATWDRVYVPSLSQDCAVRQMHWYIEKNHVIDDNTTIRLNWSKKIKSPLHNNCFTVVLYHCMRDDPPRRKDEDVRQAAIIECVVKTPFDQLPTYTNGNGDVWRSIDFQVEMLIQRTFIEFTTYFNGKRQEPLRIMAPFTPIDINNPHAAKEPGKSPFQSQQSMSISTGKTSLAGSSSESNNTSEHNAAYSLTSAVSSDPSLWSELPSRPISPATTLFFDSDNRYSTAHFEWKDFQSLVVSEAPPLRNRSESGREFGKSSWATEEVVVANKDVSPEALQLALAGRELDTIQRLLDNHFDFVADGDFFWLTELRGHGYTNDEISQLLIDEETESPWIYFEPRKIPSAFASYPYHQPSCVHSTESGLENASVISKTENSDPRDLPTSGHSTEETMIYLEQLCGLAGATAKDPSTGYQIGWVRFEGKEEWLTASISFQPPPQKPDEHKEWSTPFSLYDRPILILRSALRALENLCIGIGLAQQAGMCCDSFTCLHLASEKSLTSSLGGKDLIELGQIHVSEILRLRSKVVRLHAELQDGQVSRALFEEMDIYMEYFFLTARFLEPLASINDMVHQICLATQYFCLAFSFYLKAHVGPFQPFFLDTPLQKICLIGGENVMEDAPRITVSLYRFTCLDDMIQNPVLVFQFGLSGKEKQTSYDLRAYPEDLVDTWGPGQFITSGVDEHTQYWSAISIGGGVIKPTAEHSQTLHWSNSPDPRHGFSFRFLAGEKVVISGPVKINTTCQGKQRERWASFMSSMENLGTSPNYWQATEYQAGVAVMGQQFVGGQIQFNKTWTWHPGNSCKSRVLSSISETLPFSELDRPWGLQVSACTGVARRIPLRVLIADVITSSAENLALPPGWTTLQSRGIVKALQNGDFKKFYDDLSDLPNFQELQNLAWRLVRYVLLALRDTGVDREHKTFRIACTQDHNSGPMTMCLPIQCENASLWARILTDSEHCATFACMTTTCLESDEHKCQKTNPWHCPSLHTAVHQLRASNEAILVPPQAWTLQVNTLYWIGQPESGLQAKATRLANSPILRLHISKSGIPQRTRARLGTLSKLLGPKLDRLREKQTNSWPAEDVLILS